MAEAQAIRPQVSFHVEIGLYCRSLSRWNKVSSIGLFSCKDGFLLAHYGGDPGDVEAGLDSSRHTSLL